MTTTTTPTPSTHVTAKTPAPLSTGDPTQDSGPTSQAFEIPALDLSQFLKDHHREISRLLTDNFQPTYDPSSDSRPLPLVKRRPLGAQELAIRAAAHQLDTSNHATIVGEMGVGKTYVAITAAAAAKNIRRVVVLVPPHLTQKWKREIDMTLPSTQAHAEVVTSITQLERLKKRFGSAQRDRRMLFAVMSHWQAKTSHYWRPATAHTNGHGHLSTRPQTVRSVLACPDCGAKITDEEEIDKLTATKPKHKIRCTAIRTTGSGATEPCNAPLWSADNRHPLSTDDTNPLTAVNPGPSKYRRAALADYIGKKMKGFFDLTIADEMHQFKAKASAQGVSAGNLAAATGKSLALTGTLMGGQATTIFYLLFRFSPQFRHIYGFNDTPQWRSRFGFTETTHTWKDEGDTTSGHGAQSKRKDIRTTVRELPGITPSALFHIIGHTIFLKLRDVSNDLPPYHETVAIIPMNQAIAPGDHHSQASAYEELASKLKRALTDALKGGSKRLLSTYLQSLLAFPDGCTRGDTVIDPSTGRTIASIPPLAGNVLYPKEEALLDIIRQERQHNRKVLVYNNHVDKRDISVRLRDIISQDGHRTLIMRANNPDTSRREAWIARNAPLCDVLITNPSLVETGLDLIEFPTIIWFEPNYSVFTVRQASRRSWRIGQPHPVRVHHLVYESCMQTQALKHIALKAQTSLAIEGELPQQGLTEYGSGGLDITMQLAKQLLGQLPDDNISIEEALNLGAQQREMEEELLIDRDYTLPDIPPPAPRAVRKPQQTEDWSPDTTLLRPGQQMSMDDFLFPTP